MTPLHKTPQWIVVLLVPRPDGRTDKIPCNFATGETGVDAHDPKHWTTYAEATRIAALWGMTTGFVLTERDPFWCLDIDGALDAQTGQWSTLSQQLVQALPGTCVEVSQSGRGLHIWGQGVVPPHTMKRVDLHIELYTEKRFIAIGTGAVGDMALPCPNIAAVAAHYFPPRERAGVAPDEGPSPEWYGPEDDAELLRRAMQSRSAAGAFGGKATFADLYTGDSAVLARAFPHDTDAYDRSSADAALAQHLAFWTGRDAARIERLMRKSALYREKWDARDDYLVERTITNACSMQREVLQDKKLERADVPTAPPGGPEQTVVEGATFLGPQEQRELFKGCVYVADRHAVLVPGGELRDPARFRAIYGGYSFAMDARNERVSRNAFECFTESQVLRPTIVDGTCFRPVLPYGAIVENEGRKRVNLWWPADVKRIKGDVGRFLRHLAVLFPNENDRQIALYYFAHCVQHPGHKAQWFPLIVGVEGNAKSFLSRCLAYAVGHRYTHWPAADGLGKQFNGWLFGKLLYCIEDLRIGDAAEVWEKLKPMITGEFIEVENKGVDQRTDEICGNFIANSNHKDAIRATLNDRRVCHLWCAQQHVDDLARSGITQEYVSGLYDWARDEDGFAMVAEFLATLVIPPEFGLSWFKGRAPKTTSTGAALAAGLGRVEQEILEAVESDEQGFAGGWISSHMLGKMLERTGLRGRVAKNKQHEILTSLGYVQHPALPGGRVHNPITPDGTKPRLYLRIGHPSMALTVGGDVARAYAAAQGVR